jgi:glutamine synthetase
MQTYEEVLNFIEEENVKFIRLAFYDVFGTQKNIAIMPGELRRAFEQGISFDVSSIAGFGDEVRSDLCLKPDPTTLSIVPWRPLDGGVCRMFCDIYYPDGRPFEKDTRRILKEAVRKARKQGYEVLFGPEVEFYVFRQDVDGNPTKTPIDNAGYMAVSPADRGEDLRRDICFTLLDMGITPEASHHESGPGQNEVDFRYGDALTTADNTATFKWAVRTIVDSNGMWADFSPKPIAGKPGNGMHINMSLRTAGGKEPADKRTSMAFMAGILRYIREITLFLNPRKESYDRFGQQEAPYYISWSEQNRSQLIRIPADPDGRKRMELRSPDPEANPYLAFALLIYAGLEGIRQNLQPDLPMNINLYRADPDLTRKLDKLPSHFEEAVQSAMMSDFVKAHIPEDCIAAYCRGGR